MHSNSARIRPKTLAYLYRTPPITINDTSQLSLIRTVARVAVTRFAECNPLLVHAIPRRLPNQTSNPAKSTLTRQPITSQLQLSFQMAPLQQHNQSSPSLPFFPDVERGSPSSYLATSWLLLRLNATSCHQTLTERSPAPTILLFYSWIFQTIRVMQHPRMLPSTDDPTSTTPTAKKADHARPAIDKLTSECHSGWLLNHPPPTMGGQSV